MNCNIKGTLLITIAFIFSSCSDDVKENTLIVQNFVSTNIKSADTSIIISREELLAKFDTLPLDFATSFFDSVIYKLPESSSLKQTWTFPVDSFKLILGSRKNLRLDPKNQHSSETYYFVIYFEADGYGSIAATILADFTNSIVGTYSLGDSLKYAITHDDVELIENLTSKLTIKEKHRR